MHTTCAVIQLLVGLTDLHPAAVTVHTKPPTPAPFAVLIATVILHTITATTIKKTPFIINRPIILRQSTRILTSKTPSIHAVKDPPTLPSLFQYEWFQ